MLKLSNCVKLHTESEMNLETFLSAKYRFQGLLMYDNLLIINCSTETLSLLPLGGMVCHSYHWHKELDFSIYEARLLNVQ